MWAIWLLIGITLGAGITFPLLHFAKEIKGFTQKLFGKKTK